VSHKLKFVLRQSHLPDFDLLFLTDGGYFLGAIRILKCSSSWRTRRQ
jgi:hypothetical protein